MSYLVFFFFNDTATTEIYTLSLHDALPIWTEWTCQSPTDIRRSLSPYRDQTAPGGSRPKEHHWKRDTPDRKSTRLNSSHANISYAVFCLKKKTRHQRNGRATLPQIRTSPSR